MKKHCAFCLRNDLKITNEHAFPDWLRKLFPGDATVVHLTVEGTSRQWVKKHSFSDLLRILHPLRPTG